MSEVNRWSRVVRRKGAVQILAHHATPVAPLSGGATAGETRNGIRLLTVPLAGREPLYSIDVTSTAAIAMLEGFLRSGVAVGKVLTWSTSGFGVRRKDTLRLSNG